MRHMALLHVFATACHGGSKPDKLEARAQAFERLIVETKK